MRGRKARQKTAAGAVSKAIKGLVGGLAMGSAAERHQWTADLIPRSGAALGPCTNAQEQENACESAWGGGDMRAAK
eukprot:554606-Karenia_brevis.AAC.1